MALTQFGFLGYTTLRADALGVQVSRPDYEAYIHFFRVIGYLLGIEDRFNLCTDSWDTTRPRMEIVLEDYFKPALENPPAQFDEMISALVDGLWHFNPMLNTPAVMYFTRYLSNCSGYLYFESNLNALDEDLVKNQKNIESLGWYARILLFITFITHSYLLNFWLLRWYFNMQVLFYKYLNAYLPVLAMCSFGVKKAYVSILKTDKNKENWLRWIGATGQKITSHFGLLHRDRINFLVF